jgi:hypothetical protein
MPPCAEQRAAGLVRAYHGTARVARLSPLCAPIRAGGAPSSVFAPRRQETHLARISTRFIHECFAFIHKRPPQGGLLSRRLRPFVVNPPFGLTPQGGRQGEPRGAWHLALRPRSRLRRRDRSRSPSRLRRRDGSGGAARFMNRSGKGVLDARYFIVPVWRAWVSIWPWPAGAARRGGRGSP